MTIVRLARWLGPWAPEGRAPEVDRRSVTVPAEREGDRPLEVRLFAPADREPVGSLLVVPGLHYAGPADPRLDRFLAILAHAGILVAAPFLPDFCALRVAPGVVRDTERAFRMLIERPERPRDRRPGVFSISFGSLPAIRLASSETFRDALAGLILFGGYADFQDAIRFCLTGREGRHHDPLNRPVLFLNLLDHLDGIRADRAPIASAWERYVRATWGRPEMKARERFEAVAREVARELPLEDQELFLMGCGVAGGGAERGLRALERARRDHAWLDPRSAMAGIRCPVHIVHGREDDVIPFEHARLLHEALPPGTPVSTWLTGLYAHTGRTGLSALLALGPAAVREVRSMAGILSAIQRVSQDRAL